MSYNYETQRSEIFTEEGLKLLFDTYHIVRRLLRASGAFQANFTFTAGKEWESMACLGYLCELGIIREIQPKGPALNMQLSIFVAGNNYLP